MLNTAQWSADCTFTSGSALDVGLTAARLASQMQWMADKGMGGLHCTLEQYKTHFCYLIYMWALLGLIPESPPA
ncbi:hypothetical protein ONZ45_g15110 [Pleurotus djamor]|nr:hypothetical protein ONZ45_g15110 [Pleurotus djamor]